MRNNENEPRPLEGLMVLELGTMITAPLAGMLLAHAGADVIKVEPPKGGDPFRSFRGGELYSPNFMVYNHGKRSVKLNLQSDRGRAVFRRMLERADVLVENYRPGVLARLGLAPDDISKTYPRLIHCSITGFGATGPYSGRPAFDTIGLALSGIGASQWDAADPQIMGPTVSDYVTGMYSCYGILSALHERTRTGVGRRVEANLLECSIAVMADYVANYTQLGIASRPLSRTAASHAFAFRCADGKLLAVHLSRHEKFWTNLLATIGRPELAREEKFVTRQKRIENYQALRKELSAVFVTQPRKHWMGLLEDNDVPFAPVNDTVEVLEDPQVKHLGTLCTATHPTQGEIKALRTPVLFDGARPDIVAAPTLGEHTDSVLSDLGYSEDQIADLKKSGAI
jgi:crotonobetainyl-CoA:carnitine CoA-transferase CaiB-like acyl-CoA transferase